jgi:AAA family ATP:ADP antiporter
VLKGSQGLLRYSVDKSTTELLYLPVTPPALKGQIKSFIDGFVWRMADGIGGLALLLFAFLKFSPSRMSLLNFAFLGAWIAAAYGVRREYLTVLRSAIEHRKLDPARIATGTLDATTADVLAHSLENGSEQQVLYGMSLFELGREPAWHPVLRKLLEHPSAAVRQKTLQLLGHSRHQGMEPQVKRMLGDESLDVRAEALHYLVHQEREDPLLLLQTVRDVPAHCLQSAVAVHLGSAEDVAWQSAAAHILTEMISEPGRSGAVWRREAARALGNIPGPRDLHLELRKLLDDPDDEVAERALVSAGRLRTPELLPKIVDGLAQTRRLGATRAALLQYEDSAVELLRDTLRDTSRPARVRKEIARVLARIGTVSAARALGDSLIQADPEVRYEVIKGLNQICARYPDRVSGRADIFRMLEYELLAYCRSLQILTALEGPNGTSASGTDQHKRLVAQAMRERMNEEFERTFRLLGLLNPPTDIHNAYLSLISNRPQMQSNALEVLEHLLSPDLYRRVSIVADPDSTREQKLALADQVCQTKVESRPAALRILLHSGDAWLCACALHAIGQERVAQLESDVSALGHDDSLLKDARSWTRSRLAAHDADKGDRMLSLLEKVDLLRNARLFQAMPTQSLVRVAAIASELNWEPKQVVYHENSPAQNIYFLLEGEVELVRAGRSLAKRGPHQVPGGLAALANSNHAESAIVSQPTRALVMEREAFFDAMAEDFRVAQGIVKALAGMANGAA